MTWSRNNFLHFQTFSSLNLGPGLIAAWNSTQPPLCMWNSPALGKWEHPWNTRQIKKQRPGWKRFERASHYAKFGLPPSMYGPWIARSERIGCPWFENLDSNGNNRILTRAGRKKKKPSNLDVLTDITHQPKSTSTGRYKEIFQRMPQVITLVSQSLKLDLEQIALWATSEGVSRNRIAPSIARGWLKL